MFTGIVTAVGTVIRARPAAPGGLVLDIRAGFPGLTPGESIAVDGACLTVARRIPGGFRVRVVATTMERTRFGTLKPGDRVNLERAARVGDRLGGHLVQGHVDGVARVVKVQHRGDARLVDLAVPAAVARVSVPLGSITVAGVSLTVNAVVRQGIIQVSLIPHTLAATTLGSLGPGAAVHVEGDLLGKYLTALWPRVGRTEPRRPRTRNPKGGTKSASKRR
jgi:riboflavin synthase